MKGEMTKLPAVKRQMIVEINTRLIEILHKVFSGIVMVKEEKIEKFRWPEITSKGLNLECTETNKVELIIDMV